MVRGQRVRLQADLPDEHHLGGPVPAGAARARRRVPAGLPHTGDWPLRCAMRASGKFLSGRRGPNFNLHYRVELFQPRGRMRTKFSVHFELMMFFFFSLFVLFQLFGLFGAICLGHTYLDEDDSCK